ncbi:MAG: OsmC family protein [Actinomycetota bacterium]|nr:OsmC family protein [Actinomycetota bacterium]
MARAVARRREGYTHDVEIDGHTVVVDEPEAAGGADLGPSPTRLLAGSLASCTAITMEMYADRKGWDLGDVEVVVDMEYGQSSVPTSFLVTIKLPRELTEEQQQRLEVIAGKCPVHRVLSRETQIEIEDRIELV